MKTLFTTNAKEKHLKGTNEQIPLPRCQKNDLTHFWELFWHDKICNTLGQCLFEHMLIRLQTQQANMVAYAIP
jgi:hypothetical protein